MTYFCQSCKTPLVIDDSLEELSNAQRNLLIVNYGQKPHGITPIKHQENTPQIPEERRRLFEQALQMNPQPILTKSTQVHDSFVLLKEGENNKSIMSDRVETLDKIFDIISSRYEIDYPVCSDCASLLITQMKTKVNDLDKEKETYVQFLKKLGTQSNPDPTLVKGSLNELAHLKAEEQSILDEIKNEEKRHMELTQNIKKIENEITEMKIEEERCCMKKNKFELDIAKQFDMLDKSKSEYYKNLDLLDNLRNTNVFDNIFEISHKGEFGTINGLRLGNLPEEKVTWHENNAALGQIVLLLSTCINILGIELEDYKLIPMGSTSRIEKIEADGTGNKIKTEIKLFTSGEYSLAGFFTHNSLDNGMVVLLEVVDLIASHLQSLDSRNELPYPIKGDRVAGLNIRPSSRTKWESWTTACKYFLVDLKWVESFTMAQYLTRGD